MEPEAAKSDAAKYVTNTSQYQDYNMRPNVKERFQVNTVKEVIYTILNEELMGRSYDADEVVKLSLHLSDLIKRKVMELELRNYKLVVQVVIGEQKGMGVRICSRCLWDADTDNLASQLFISDSIFCMAVVFGVFVY